MATILILAPRRVFKTVCSSFSSTAKSPTTNASSATPAKAAQVLTPMVLPVASTRHLYFSPNRDLIHSVVRISLLPMEALCKEAMEGCPVEATGNNGEG